MGNVLIKTPRDLGNGLRDTIMVSGDVAYLRLGSRKRFKVLLQDEPAYLLDYRTGFRIPSALGANDQLSAEAIYIMATRSTSHKRDPRTCAQLRLDMLVERLGEEKIFAKLDATPTLNEE